LTKRKPPEGGLFQSLIISQSMTWDVASPRGLSETILVSALRAPSATKFVPDKFVEPRRALLDSGSHPIGTSNIKKPALRRASLYLASPRGLSETILVSALRAPSATKFAPDKFVEPRRALLDSGSHPIGTSNIKKPALRRASLYLASPRGFEPLLPP
jgi:hypothetical protein